ncbi:MAG: Cof-type HAD-IIB family hydrolase [Bacteroides sp.]|nr:Cof-type HAD-IIB family hydrolase [Bacteroides sp.]
MTNIYMRHLYISDMDGTLLGTDSKVSDESARIISTLSRRGIPITVATARTPATVDVLLHDTYITVPAIVMTGAALWDIQSHRYIDPITLTPEAAAEVTEVFSEMGVNPFVYVMSDEAEKLKVYHHTDFNRQERNFYEERRHLQGKRFILGDVRSITAPPAGTILIYGMDEASRIEAVAEKLRGYPALSVSCYRDIFNSDIANIEIFANGVSKASAIKRLAGRVGADRITAYGDNLNDLPMFEVADEAVAVANAVPEVLAKADRVIGPNSTSSVARDILEHNS